MNKNLWPDFDIAKAARSPKTVIEECGAGLEEKTNGILKFWAGYTTIRKDVVETQFTLYNRVLEYHYPFLTAKFSVDALYPVTLVPDKMKEGKANNEKELIEALANIFNAPSTKETIERLMALSA